MKGKGNVAKYIVTENCYGFKNRYWEKGDVVELDPKEEPPVYFKLFTVEFKIDRNGTRAAIRAKYSPRSATMQASRLLTNDNVKARINPAPEKKLPGVLDRKAPTVEKKKRWRYIRKLTDKQKNFIKAFLKKLQGTKAVVEAYPEVKNRNTAGVMAHELRHNPKINKIIEEQFNKGNCACDFVDFEITE